MDDKEIGELWRSLTSPYAHGDTYYRSVVENLIRKLVEERTRFYGEHMTLRHFAVRDFGIDPDEFRGVK